MKPVYLRLLIILTIGISNIYSQNKNNMQEQISSLLYDIETGICEIPSGKTDTSFHNPIQSTKKL